MSKPVWINHTEINELQTRIMLFVDDWVHTKKTPIPQKDIIAAMLSDGVKTFTTVGALNTLLKKGYIRRAITVSNKTMYVQLRRA